MRAVGAQTRGTAAVRSRSFLPDRGSTIAVTDIRCARSAAQVRRNVSCVKRRPGRDTARRSPQRQREPFRFTNVAEDPPACRIVTTCSKPRRTPVSSRRTTRPSHRRPWCWDPDSDPVPGVVDDDLNDVVRALRPARMVLEPLRDRRDGCGKSERQGNRQSRAEHAPRDGRLLPGHGELFPLGTSTNWSRSRSHRDGVHPWSPSTHSSLTATGGGPEAITDRPADRLGTRARVHDRPRPRR